MAIHKELELGIAISAEESIALLKKIGTPTSQSGQRVRSNNCLGFIKPVNGAAKAKIRKILHRASSVENILETFAFCKAKPN
jgi:hypothetical protein